MKLLLLCALIPVSLFGQAVNYNGPTYLPDPTRAIGDMVYRSASGVVRLPIGSNGQCLGVVNGAPGWIACATGGPGGGISTFDQLGTGVNTTAVMTLGNGAVMTYGGTGYINANRIMGVALTTITGLVKMTAGIPSAADAGTDFQAPITGGPCPGGQHVANVNAATGAITCSLDSGSEQGASLPATTNLIKGAGDGTALDSGIAPAAVVQTDNSRLVGTGKTPVDTDSTQTIANKTIGTATPTEINYVHGVTSGIQAQIDAKMANPMTTQDDMIVGGASGAPARIPLPNCNAATEKVRWNNSSHAWECVTDQGVGTQTVKMDGTTLSSSATGYDIKNSDDITWTPVGNGTIMEWTATINPAAKFTLAMAQAMQPWKCTSSSGSATAYTCTTNPALSSYGATAAARVSVLWTPDLNCTGGVATTLNAGPGAIAIKKADGTTDPAASDCTAGKPMWLHYDGTVFRIGGGGGSSSGGGDSYLKLTVAYSNAALAANATQVSVPFASALPANAVITKLCIKQSTAFAGTGVTSMTASLGRSLIAQSSDYAPAFDVFQAAATTTFYCDVGFGSKDLASHTPYLWLTSNVAVGNGSATVLTAGSVDAWIFYQVLP